MALQDADTPFTPAWWMTQLAARLLDSNRRQRIATLAAYRSGCPPMSSATEMQREGYRAFCRVSRSNFARPIITSPAQRMAIRSIRTAAVNDDDGDSVAWRYWTANSLDIDATDVHSDMLTFGDIGGYVRTGIGPDGRPVALRRDPWQCITAEDPLNPHRTMAAFELVHDEWRGRDYAYLWLPGQQWVAERPRTVRPPSFALPGVRAEERRWAGVKRWYPRLSFDSKAFTMRPNVTEVETLDGGPYSETYTAQVVPVVHFPNRDGVGEFEEHLDVLDRINHTIMIRVVTAAVQAYKQRALKQDGAGGDRLPETDPRTGEKIDWDALFQPGPDALWKLPPGVDIWESKEIQLQPILQAVDADVKHLSVLTGTPFSIFSPDGANQSAEGASGNKEMGIFKIEDRDRIAGRCWADVISQMFQFAPDEDRYDSAGNDRADAGKIVIDWFPAERYTLQEKAQADAANKSLSPDMAAAKIWQLTPDEVAINRTQRAGEMLLAGPTVTPNATTV